MISIHKKLNATGLARLIGTISVVAPLLIVLAAPSAVLVIKSKVLKNQLNQEVHDLILETRAKPG